MESIKVGWVNTTVPDGKGGYWNERNFRGAKPDNVEIVDIDINEPEECHIFAIHSDEVPKNLPLFPKEIARGKSRLRPVVVYANHLQINAFGASHVIYQSPLQASFHKFGKKHIIPPPVAPADYTPSEPVERTERTMWFGDFLPDDGIDIAIRWSEVNKIATDYYGYKVPAGVGSTPNSFFRGEPNPDNLATLFASYSRIVFFARSKQPFNRHLAEAALAGCEILYSGDLGIESFDKPADSVVEDMKDSTVSYWDYLMDLI